MVSVALLPIAVVPSGLYLYWGGRSTLVGNILAVSFAHNAISMVKLDSVRTGAILLIGLFVYDVWWVFGTEVASITFFNTY
jgi:minor histocompatibility antigen H13